MLEYSNRKIWEISQFLLVANHESLHRSSYLTRKLPNPKILIFNLLCITYYSNFLWILNLKKKELNTK